MALPHWPFVSTPDSPEWQAPSKRFDEDLRFFADMAEYTDTAVGRIVGKIDELGLSENTLVIFYSDNGTHLKITSQTQSGPVAGGKGLTTDAGTHVPLIVRWPGNISAGVSDDLVDSTDFLPTLLEAAGHPIRESKNRHFDGQSFYPRLLGQQGSPREWVFCHFDPRPGWDKDRFRLLRFARDKRFKLYDNGRLFDIANDVLEQQPILTDKDTPPTQAARKRLAAGLTKMERPLWSWR